MDQDQHGWGSFGGIRESRTWSRHPGQYRYGAADLLAGHLPSLDGHGSMSRRGPPCRGMVPPTSNLGVGL
ncbi:hypothetical protein PR202_ga29764 [Eleusine coracana subsp. coracana]|uniref:Uncharacterized protein n=1 Tax=Eleusine coracana subsp. coracana TaxID=191504 RepID=A0AAV5DMY6_ELECO|nr:hypothetical protein PR202_ga29764 [Eleusine coracana subsp. coracana]